MARMKRSTLPLFMDVVEGDEMQKTEVEFVKRWVTYRQQASPSYLPVLISVVVKKRQEHIGEVGCARAMLPEDSGS